MSKRELVQLFTAGDIDRRDFIRRLTLTGVSAGAAIAYAQSLAPSASAAVDNLIISQYGGGVVIEDLEEAIQAVVEIAEAVADFASDGLENFASQDFEDLLGNGVDVFAELETLVDQIDAEVEVLSGAIEALGIMIAPTIKGRAAFAVSRLQSATPDEYIATLGDLLDVQAQLYAGIIPALGENGAVAQDLTSLAIVKGSQAGFLRLLRGLSAFPSSLETPISPEDAQAQIDAILAG